MLFGIDQVGTGQFSTTRRKLRSSRVGVLTHAAAVDRRGLTTLAALEELGVHPRVVFAPEHGLDGAAQAQIAVPSPDRDEEDDWSLKVISLYGANKDSLSPDPAHFESLDVLLIDLCDIGARFYTYVWSALLAARVAAEQGVHTLVLDRPNPITGHPDTIEGGVQSEGFTSFVGWERVPIRHALTLGEMLARCLAADGKELGPDGALSIVPTRGWERYRTAAAWGRPFIPPSPNMPTVDTALVYPGGCLLEGTNLSEGRGTTTPFQSVGAPFLDGEKLCQALRDTALPGFIVRPVSFRPTFDKHEGELCGGVMIHVTDPLAFRPVSTYLSLITLAALQAPEQFRFNEDTYEFENEIPAFDLLTGDAEAREAIDRGDSPAQVSELVAPVDPSWRDEIAAAEERAREASA